MYCALQSKRKNGIDSVQSVPGNDRRDFNTENIE